MLPPGPLDPKSAAFSRVVWIFYRKSVFLKATSYLNMTLTTHLWVNLEIFGLGCKGELPAHF